MAIIVVSTGGVAVMTLVRAFAKRIAGGPDATDGRREIESLRDEVADLRAELDETRARLGGGIEELHGRLDFAERMLAQGKEKNALPGAR